MLKWIKSNSKALLRKVSDYSDAKLIEQFAGIKSIQDCEAAMYTVGCSQNEFVSVEWLLKLKAACKQMRAEGMALEPNLISRTMTRRIAIRSEAGLWSELLGSQDTDFVAILSKADHHRNAREFQQAEYQYWQALELYPRHPGYLVQYAHCLKEQGKWHDALLDYLNSCIYGANIDDLLPHIADTLKHCEDLKKYNTDHLIGLRDAPNQGLSARADKHDVRSLSKLFTNIQTSNTDTCKYMLSGLSRRDIVIELIRADEFKFMNINLLTLIKEQGSTIL